MRAGATGRKAPPTDLTFRQASADDVPAVHALVTSAYRGESSRAGWTTEADLIDGPRTDAEEITSIISAPDSLVLVAEWPGPGGPEIVACCELQRHGETGYFGMFAVRPTAQLGGLGSAVLAEAERHARERWGARRMEMQVIAQRDQLLAWYARRGYTPTGETRPFPYGQPRFGVPRRDDLVFAVLAKPLTGESA